MAARRLGGMLGTMTAPGRTHRRVATALIVLPLAWVAAWPAGSAARHSDCEWGPAAWVDPSADDPVRVYPIRPAWGCTGPVTEVHVHAGDRTMQVRGEGTDVRMEVDQGDASRSSAPASSAPQPAPSESRIHLSVAPLRVIVGKPVRFRFRTTRVAGGSAVPAGGTTIRFAGRRIRTDRRSGRAGIAVTLRRAGEVTVAAYRDGRRVAVRTVRASRRPVRR